ncbi:MAG: MlaD family protein [Gemmataceae bacterium]
MSEKGLRLQIGLFVVLAIVLLAAMITLFGGFPTIFRSTNRYVVLLDNAQGVSNGTPVRRSGVPIGEVQGLDLDNETGQVKVTLLLQRRYVMYQSEIPTVTHGLLGDTTIDLLPRPDAPAVAERTPVPTGGTVQGASQADARTLTNQVSEVVPTAQQALQSMAKLAERFDKMAPQTEDMLKEFRTLGKAVQDAIPELRKSGQELSALSQLLRKTVPDFEKTNERIQKTADSWGQVGDRLDKLLAANEDKVSRSIDNLDATLKKVNNLLTDDNQREFNAALKNINAVLSDENQKNFNNTLRGMSEFLSAENRQKVTTALNGITNVLSEENQKNLSTTLQNASTASGRFEEMSKGMDQTLKRVEKSLDQADGAIADLRKTLKPFAERSDNLAKNMDEGLEKINQLTTDMQSVLFAAAQGEGTLSLLLNDPTLYNNLADISCMAARMMPRVERILRDAEVFADKLARHPEAIGLGGVVRPGSGLKNPPTAVPMVPCPPYGPR